MSINLIRHFQEIPQIGSNASIWFRTVSCLTLLIPLITCLTVGRKTKQTSDQYYLPTTPPDSFFRIWILIFIFQTGFMIYSAINDHWVFSLWFLYILINIFCGIWAFAFNSGKLWGVNLSIFFMVLNLCINQLAWLCLGRQSLNVVFDSIDGIIVRNMVSFMNGWFIAAAGLGISIVLVYTFGLDKYKQLIFFWIAAPVAYICFFVKNLSAPNGFIGSIGMVISMVWAVVGALISSRKYLQNQKSQLK